MALESGHTTINHQVRMELGISYEQYCILDLVERRQSAGAITPTFMSQKLKMNKDTVVTIARELREKGFLNIKKSPRVTSKWLSAFEISDEEFSEFWKPEHGKKWTGSRKDARDKYNRARRQYSAQHLLNQKRYYFRFLSLEENDFRQTMGASVFLNLQTERFNEDFRASLKEEQTEIINKPITKEDVDELFGRV